MTKTWEGPTPYPDKRIREPEELVALLSLRQGYRAAMNSPEVVAMYEMLRDTRSWDNRAHLILAAYEVGLKETTDDDKSTTP